MKILTLRAVTLCVATGFASAALAGVTINGTQFEKFKLNQSSSGDLKLKTYPTAVVPEMPDEQVPKLTKADYQVDVSSDSAGDAVITTIPAFTLVNCELTPLDAACGNVVEPPPPGECGEEGAELVFETLNWRNQPNTTTIHIGKKVKSSKFVTTTSNTYAGSVSIVPTTAQGHVWRRVWVSECPGGDALDQSYSFRGQAISKCDQSGTQLALNWTQESTPGSILDCKLEKNKEYYLNYSNEGCTTSDCPMYRSTGSNGKS